MSNDIEMLFGSYNVQVFDMIDGKIVSPFVRWNPNLSGNFPNSSGGEDYTVDIDAESLETIVLEAEPHAIEEAFRQSMVPAVTGIPMTAMPGESSRISSMSTDSGHLERLPEVPISRYFMVLEIHSFLLHENSGIVGFSKERPKFNI